MRIYIFPSALIGYLLCVALSVQGQINSDVDEFSQDNLLIPIHDENIDLRESLALNNRVVELSNPVGAGSSWEVVTPKDRLKSSELATESRTLIPERIHIPKFSFDPIYSLVPKKNCSKEAWLN